MYSGVTIKLKLSKNVTGKSAYFYEKITLDFSNLFHFNIQIQNNTHFLVKYAQIEWFGVGCCTYRHMVYASNVCISYTFLLAIYMNNNILIVTHFMQIYKLITLQCCRQS